MGVRPDRYGLTDQRHRSGMISGLMVHQAEPVERIRVPGLTCQDMLIQGRSLVQPPRSVKFDSRPEDLTHRDDLSGKPRPSRAVWWLVREHVTRNHRCHDLGELMGMVMAYLESEAPFRLEDEEYQIPMAA